MAWRRNFGVVATPGYFIADTPWAGYKSQAATWGERTQNSGELSGGTSGLSGGNTGTHVKDHWLAAGTFKYAQIHWKDPSTGITTIKFGASTIGTIDTYAAATTKNNYTEITAFVNAAAKVDALELSKPTKNASASDYTQAIQTYALVRTGA